MHISMISTIMLICRKIIQMNLYTKYVDSTDIENKLMVIKNEREGGTH